MDGKCRYNDFVMQWHHPLDQVGKAMYVKYPMTLTPTSHSTHRAGTASLCGLHTHTHAAGGRKEQPSQENDTLTNTDDR